MTSINATLNVIRRIRQLEAELLDYSDQIELVEEDDSFDFPFWQGITDEAGWLEEDIAGLRANLFKEAIGVSTEALLELMDEMEDAHDVQSSDNRRIYKWRKNDFDDEVTRTVIWTKLSDIQLILEEKQVWLEEDGIYTDKWVVRIRYCDE